MKGFGLVRGVLAASVSLSVLVGLPYAAMAQEEWMEPTGDVRGAALDPSVALDRKFDMRADPAYYVSDVMSQEPWGTCWAFGPTAAAESSIYADMGQKVDLSERHLAWFAHTPIAEVDDPTQVGEGIYRFSSATSPNERLNSGWWHDVSTAYASGVGPVLESAWPYHGKDSLTEYEALRSKVDAWKEDYYLRELADKTDAEIAELLKEEKCKTIDEYLEVVYQGMYSYVTPTVGNRYSPLDDWSIPAKDEAGRSVRNQSAGFLVKDVNTMPGAIHIDEATKLPVLNEVTISAVKQELRRGHGVAVDYNGISPALPEQQPTYMRAKTYAQYTWKEDESNHTVCIVGWDDDYAVSNFNQGTVTEETDKGPVTYDMAPPGPGAWIVKNSWGMEGGTETKKGGPLGADFTQVIGDSDWGVDGTGYFYLSYYDQSVSGFTSYSFVKDAPVGQTVSHQYDYLCTRPQYEDVTAAKLSAANVFDVEQDETLTSVGAQTLDNMYDITMVYAIYRLREGATSPVDGELLDTFSCLYAYPGYHREQLDEPLRLNKGDRISVVVTQSYVDSGGKRFYALCACAAETEKSAREKKLDQYGMAVVNRGESWAFKDGKWQDWLDVLAADPEADPSKIAIDNFCIKAFAQPVERGTYRWTSSGGATWRKGTTQGLAFSLARTERAEDTAGGITGVTLDGRRLSEGDYNIARRQDGATVTLAARLLEGLAAGPHTLEVALDDADALRATFTVEERRVYPEPDPYRPFPDDGDVHYTANGMYYTTWRGTYDSTDDASGSTSGSSAVTRVAGADRYQTMAEVVSGAFPSSGACVVASGASFADALAAAGLAGALRAPVVLTSPGSLSPQAAAEISRLGARRAFLMGGEAALSPAVADAVSALGAEVVRVAGADRASTSVEALRRAREAGSASDTVLVASGAGFADALAAGPWAWSKAAPVLLCGADGLLTPEAAAEIASDPGVRRIVVLGGASAVRDVASQLPAGVACERIGGADRYETARLVAERASREGLSFSVVYVASGTSFADALAAGPAAGARGGVLLLADPEGSSLAATLREHHDAVGSVTFVGGEAAVGTSAFEAAQGALR